MFTFWNIITRFSNIWNTLRKVLSWEPSLIIFPWILETSSGYFSRVVMKKTAITDNITLEKVP